MSDDATVPAPVLRFEEAAQERDSKEHDIEEIPIVSIFRSNCSKVLVSLVRSKCGARGPLISLCVWFRNERQPGWVWSPDKRRRGAILMPNEISKVIEALEKARDAAQDSGWKPGSRKAPGSDGDTHAE